MTSAGHKNVSEVDHDFLNRTFKVSMILSFALGVVAAFYFGWHAGLDFTVGALWGTFSLKFLQFLITETLRPDGARLGRAVLAVFLKFPLLYGGGILYLVMAHPSGIAVLAGFSLVLVVIVLRVLGRVLIESAWFSRPMSSGGNRR